MAVLDANKVVSALKSASESSSCNRAVLLQLVADEIRKGGEIYTSVYMYMLHKDSELRLEAFSGRPTEHCRIEVGRGVCGSAVALGCDHNVGNVKEHPNYIACNLHTQSELVVLIRDRNCRIIGQIDVDSDHLHPFSPQEQSSVKQIADALGLLLHSIDAPSSGLVLES